jgi:hypothetical protein
MALVDVELAWTVDELPAEASRLIETANELILTLEEDWRSSIPAFVPSDFRLVYHGLAAIKLNRLSTGRRFVEWGSGLGVVTCLATLAGFDAVGIEIEPRLVEMACELADRHAIATQFATGSFVPPDVATHFDWTADVAWLTTDGPNGYAELELDPDDFDLVFAYPWPGDEQVIFDLFAQSAAVGALLLTYHGLEGLRLQRKVRG